MKRFDDRVREYIYPAGIIKTFGDVTGQLCEDDLRQVTFASPSQMVFNGKGAGILLDFGREIHGGVVIEVISVNNEEQFATARLSLGESVGEALSHIGEKGATNHHAVRDGEIVLTVLSTQEYFCTGFRFAFLELTEECTVCIKSIQAVFIYEPYDMVGEFNCSDMRLNEIFSTAAYTVKLCLQNQLWDGIKRDRLVWIGDMAPEMKAIKYLYGYVPQIESGLDLATYSHNGWANGMATYSLWWLVDAYEWCFYQNDFTFIDEHRDFIVDLVRRIIEATDEKGVFIAGDFIDWPSFSKGRAMAERRIVAVRALEYKALSSSLKMLERFNDKKLIALCKRTMKRIKAYEAVPMGTYRQLAALTELAGLGNEYTAATLSKKGVKGFSTFMSYYILSAMAKLNLPTLEALKKYYGGMLDMGATTFWEDFDIDWAKNACPIDEIPDGIRKDVHGDNGAYCYVGYRHSLCHGWSSGPVPFLIEHVLGITFDEADSTRIILTPHLESLDFAKGSIMTPYGKVSVSYKKVGDRLVSAVSAPKEITVERCF